MKTAAKDDPRFMEEPIQFLQFMQKLTPEKRCAFITALKKKDYAALAQFGMDAKWMTEHAQKLKLQATELCDQYPELFRAKA
jgi:hypothetical protein